MPTAPPRGVRIAKSRVGWSRVGWSQVGSLGFGGSGVCDLCLSKAEAAGPVSRMFGVDQVEALFVYDDLVRRVVLCAKNRGRAEVLRQLGLLLAERADASHVGRSDDQPYDLVTWVPASRAGKRRRGFDQGAVLAEMVADRLGAKSRRLLLRRRGQAQIGQGREARMGGPQVRAPMSCTGRVLLVDDVITTGSSMSASALALRRSGAEEVHGLAVAWVAPEAFSGSRCQG